VIGEKTKMNNSNFTLNSENLLKLIDMDKYKGIRNISSIISKDMKNTSYKLALLRAFCDISEKFFNCIDLSHKDKAGIPIDFVADLWILYYWEFINSDKFFPQRRGESPESFRKIAFRNELTDFVEKYRDSGGLSGFYNDYINNKVQFPKLYNKLKDKLKNTIIKGPVFYSGNYNGENPFNYSNNQIWMDSELWYEITAFNYLIRESVILKWVEFVREISELTIGAGTILEKLIINPVHERDVSNARDVFMKLDDIKCVWTHGSIKKFEVDHIIPFSLWKNNDLWNLLPTRPDVNNRKRDKLPTNKLLISSKDLIIHYWQILEKDLPIRFLQEVNKFNGNFKDEYMIKNWENITFKNLVKSIEYTAIQRGCERWEA